MSKPGLAELMDIAVTLSRRNLGRTGSNPSVGCVVVADDHVVGRGWTQAGGRPHAETEALRRAGPAARGAVALVTLEPCAHHGETLPCTDALIEAGISRVVIALRDPDSRVAGRGIARLRAAGIVVNEGVGSREARAVLAGYLRQRSNGMPWVTLKFAATLDGRIATASKNGRWITGPDARARVHLLRAQHDAVIVGINTVLHDDPLLDCRLPGMEDASPIRVIFDTHLRFPSHAAMLCRGGKPVWLLTGPEPDVVLSTILTDLGVRIMACPIDMQTGHLDITVALRLLADGGLTRLLVEGGAKLGSAFLSEGLADRIAWFTAPTLLGSDGVAVAAFTGLTDPSKAPRFHWISEEWFGEDRLSWYKPDVLLNPRIDHQRRV